MRATPSLADKKNSEAVSRKSQPTVERPSDVSQKVWQDFLAVRKTKRLALTGTALDGIKREADKAGLTLEQAITVCCETGWAGFRSDWYANRMGGRGAPHGSNTASLHTGFSQRNYSEGVNDDGTIQ